jgi:hypothetical protein
MAGLAPLLGLSPPILLPLPDLLPVKTHGKGGLNTLLQNTKQVQCLKIRFLCFPLAGAWILFCLTSDLELKYTG